MKKMNKKGISLIVLVITIIVIIILAAAVILSLSNNNPIANARKAKAANDEAAQKELASAAYSYWYIQNKLGLNAGNAQEYIQNELRDKGFTDEEVDKIGMINGKVVYLKEPVVPNGFVASEATGENSITNGFVIYESDVPVTDETVVEARKTKNQFVWVPVPDIAEFTVTQEGYLNGTLQDKLKDCSEPNTADATEVAEYNAMKASIEKYGGFYIARYEATKGENDIPKSIKGELPWRLSVNSYTAASSPMLVARKMYPNSETKVEKDVVSTLVYGSQWDTILKWLEANYPGISKESSEYANYYDVTFTYTDTDGTTKTKTLNKNIRIPTGSAERTKTNNIYDLAGNEYEWTMENAGPSARVLRGAASNYFKQSTISTRYVITFTSNMYHNNGFRVALYVK